MKDFIDDLLDEAEAAGDIPEPRDRRSLENYVRVTKNFALDPWQIDLCRRIETAFWIAQADKFEFEFELVDIGVGPAFYFSPSGIQINKQEFDAKKGKGSREAIHAPPQWGKSCIISQCYPAWILGWDPMHRFRLATYNMLHSARFSVVVKYLLNSPEHKAMFPDRAGHLPHRTRTVEWSTNARIENPDGQASFSALGLESGFVGTGFDTLIMDDPYSSAEKALSEEIRDKSWRFWTDTAMVRANDHSNAFIMFHRYHQDDIGGRAIASGEFGLLRYAAEADGDYVDDESGRSFPDPIGRQVGEYLSTRFSPHHYASMKKNEAVWLSQFQGQPTAKTGKLFNVTLMLPKLHSELPPIVHWVRAWDNAATSGGGAYTAGPLVGIDAAENIYIFDMVREQVNTAERQILQQKTAEKDGKLVEIHAPEDPGAAGKDIAFDFEQVFARQGYKVTISKAGSGDDTSGNRAFSMSKTMRALGFSKAVNSSQVFLVLSQDGTTPDWHKPFKSELQHFPTSTYKDQVDSASDAYKHLMRLIRRGLVIKTAATHNLLHRSLFEQRFGMKIPNHAEVSAAVRIAPDASRPSGFCITARAPENWYMGDVIFIMAAARLYTDNPIQVLTALQQALVRTCEKGVNHPSVIWLNKGASDILQVTAQKMDMHLCEFTDDATAGIPETNYYLQPVTRPSPFYKAPGGLPRIGAARCYALVDDLQWDEDDVKDEDGMLSLRQDWSSWSYTDKGEVQPFAGITLDCLRMNLYCFALSATGLTSDERLYAQLPANLQPAAVAAKLHTPEFVEAYFAQNHAITMLRIKEAEERSKLRRTPGGIEHVGAQAVTRRFSRGYRR